MQMTWLLRGLLALGGAVLVIGAWPVARSALQAQRADTVLRKLNPPAQSVDLPEVVTSIAALDRAVASDPTAGRRLQRAELLAGVALRPELKLAPEQQEEWLRRARADLAWGLARDPARGIDWLRYATVLQALDGASREVVPPLLMSIDVSPMLSLVWPYRLRLILDNWGFFTERQRAELATYVARTWRRTEDRREFGWVIREPVDEMIVRYFLRNEPGAQEELKKWIMETRKN